MEAELERLKTIFHRGHSLTVQHLPDSIGYSQNGKALSGEVNGLVILIYEGNLDLPLQTLRHEFIEYCFITPLMKKFYTILHHQQLILAQKDEIMHKLLMESQENVVDSIAISLEKMVKDV